MNDTALYLELISPQQANRAVRERFFPYCKAKLDEGLCLAVTVTELEDARSLEQNKLYWHFLGEISDQAKLNGIGATKEGWHLYFRRKFLGYKFTTTRLPGNKRPSVIRELRSTRGLSVKKMAEYTTQVTAEAASEFGVMFSVREDQHG